jgi:hypothetical protein
LKTHRHQPTMNDPVDTALTVPPTPTPTADDGLNRSSPLPDWRAALIPCLTVEMLLHELEALDPESGVQVNSLCELRLATFSARVCVLETVHLINCFGPDDIPTELRWNVMAFSTSQCTIAAKDIIKFLKRCADPVHGGNPKACIAVDCKPAFAAAPLKACSYMLSMSPDTPSFTKTQLNDCEPIELLLQKVEGMFTEGDALSAMRLLTERVDKYCPLFVVPRNREGAKAPLVLTMKQVLYRYPRMANEYGPNGWASALFSADSDKKNEMVWTCKFDDDAMLEDYSARPSPAELRLQRMREAAERASQPEARGVVTEPPSTATAMTVSRRPDRRRSMWSRCRRMNPAPSRNRNSNSPPPPSDAPQGREDVVGRVVGEPATGVPDGVAAAAAEVAEPAYEFPAFVVGVGCGACGRSEVMTSVDATEGIYACAKCESEVTLTKEVVAAFEQMHH